MAKFGLLVIRPKRKVPEIRTITARSAAEAKRKFLGTEFHERTEAVPLKARRLKRGEIAFVGKKK